MPWFGLVLCAELVLAQGLPTTAVLPIVDGPAASRSTPFIAWYEDLSAQGYAESEYLISGQANLYGYASPPSEPPNSSGLAHVEVVQRSLPYTSRLLVRAPRRAEDFSGTVFVEVLNPTAGWDGDPIWQMTHDYILRSGGAYVGLTSKPVALRFLRDSWGSADEFPKRNNDRYASLEMPAFGQVWDMLTDTARLLRGDTPHNPLAGYPVQRLVLVGYSQSVAYQVTYANSFHPRVMQATGQAPFDGYFLAAGGAAAKHVNPPVAEQESLPLGDPRNRVQVAVPVVRFQTQTEIAASHAVRQTEATHPLMRTYELAGGAHVDQITNAVGGVALERDLGLPNFAASCELALNPVPIGVTQSALLAALEAWIATDQPPPPSRLLEMVERDGAPAIALDADGNALGGVRPPLLELARGQYLASNTGAGFCFLIGGFVPFDHAQLVERYDSPAAYGRRLDRLVEQAVQDGFLLRADAAAVAAGQAWR